MHIKLYGGNSSIIDKTYPIFKTTSCAIAYATKKPEQEACFNTYVCKNDNKCPIEQRKRCAEFYRKLEKIDVTDVMNILKKLNVIDDNSKCYIEINEKDRLIDIQGVELSTKEFSLLSLLTKYKIKAIKSNSDHYWNSLINDAKQIII